MPAKVAAIEYDLNRTARIALLHYADGEKRYILAPVGVNVGDALLSGEAVDIRPGNALPIKAIPLGTVLHNVESQPGSGGKMIRPPVPSASSWRRRGCTRRSACLRRGPQGPRVQGDHRAALERRARASASARPASRWLGRRPTVRGLAMNPVDHPHGGGEGKSGQGNPHPVSPGPEDQGPEDAKQPPH